MNSPPPSTAAPRALPAKPPPPAGRAGALPPAGGGSARPLPAPMKFEQPPPRVLAGAAGPASPTAQQHSAAAPAGVGTPTKAPRPPPPVSRGKPATPPQQHAPALVPFPQGAAQQPPPTSPVTSPLAAMVLPPPPPAPSEEDAKTEKEKERAKEEKEREQREKAKEEKEQREKAKGEKEKESTAAGPAEEKQSDATAPARASTPVATSVAANAMPAIAAEAPAGAAESPAASPRGMWRGTGDPARRRGIEISSDELRAVRNGTLPEDESAVTAASAASGWRNVPRSAPPAAADGQNQAKLALGMRGPLSPVSPPLSEQERPASLRHSRNASSATAGPERGMSRLPAGVLKQLRELKKSASAQPAAPAVPSNVHFMYIEGPVPDEMNGLLGTAQAEGEGDFDDPACKKFLKRLLTDWDRARAQLAMLRRDKPQTAMDKNLKSLSNCPMWVPDEFSTNCTYCERLFTMINRRHHCRKCGALLCNDCTSFQLFMPELQAKTPVRICFVCMCSYLEDEGDAQKLFTGSGAAIQVAAAASSSSSSNAQTSRDMSEMDDDDSEDEEIAPAPQVIMPEDQRERLRLACIKEIISTEQAYLDDLKIVEEVFLMPIRFTHVLTDDQIQKLFSNVEMLSPVHKEVLEKLLDDKVTQNGNLVGNIFKNMCQYFKMYSAYCANQDQALRLLDDLKENAEFQKTLAVCHSDSRAKGIFLNGYIIKPVQRICKYPLFFRELLKFTVETHPDYKELVEARDKIDEVVRSVNESKRKHEQQQKIMEIRNSIEGVWEEELVQVTRKYVSEAQLRGLDLRTMKEHEYKLFLFEDLLVVAKIAAGVEGIHHKKPLVLKGEIPMTQCRVVVIADNIGVRNAFEVHRGAAEAVVDRLRTPAFQFYARTESEKFEAIKAIRSLVKDSYQKKIKKSTAGK